MKFLRSFSLVIFYLLLTTAAFAANPDIPDPKLQKKVDSLFVIASSGEVKYRDMVAPAIEAIAKQGAPAVPILLNKINTKSARERLTIIDIFTKIGSPAVPKLVEALGRPDWLVVQRVCWALGDIKDSNAVEALKQVAYHPNWQVREYAVRALGLIGNMRGLPTVIKAFSDSLGPVRKAAAFAAGGIKSPQAIPSLVSALGDDFYGARFAASEALLLLDTQTTINQLRDSLPAATGLKANLICQTLGKIGHSDALSVLNEALDSDKMENRTFAAVAIMSADPTDLCGFHARIHQKVIDRLALVQIESARKAAQNVQKSAH